MSVMARCAATPRICDRPNPVTACTSVAAPVASARGSSNSGRCWPITRSMSHLGDAGSTNPATLFTSSSTNPGTRSMPGAELSASAASPVAVCRSLTRSPGAGRPGRGGQQHRRGVLADHPIHAPLGRRGPPDPSPPVHQQQHAAEREALAVRLVQGNRLSRALVLLLVNRVAGFVLPASPKWLIDRVIGQHRPELLLPLALATGAATLVQAVTGLGLSQILGVAAQRAIPDMRRTGQAYVLRLPVSYFDSTKSGILIS